MKGVKRKYFKKGSTGDMMVKTEIKLTAFLSFTTYPRPKIFLFFNFFAFINSMRRLIEASEIKKNIENDNNQTEIEISDIKPPPIILKVYNVARIKRSIKNNAISVNKIKVTDDTHLVDSSALIHGKYIFLENGKKNKFLLTFE